MASLPSLRAEYAKNILYKHALRKYNAHHDLGDDNSHLPQEPPKIEPNGNGPTGKIGIIGAGAAGLQVALALLWAGYTDFEILEASDRVGGRAYTVAFPDDSEHPCPHNFYDAGAMRIPEIAAMDRYAYSSNT